MILTVKVQVQDEEGNVVGETSQKYESIVDEPSVNIFVEGVRAALDFVEETQRDFDIFHPYSAEEIFPSS